MWENIPHLPLCIRGHSTCMHRKTHPSAAGDPSCVVMRRCVICWSMTVCLFNHSFIQETCTKQCMRNETSKRHHCRCLVVSGLEVEIFRHLKIQFRFRVTIWFQNDSRCISIFPAKDFSEILNYNMPALIHKQIKISQYNQNNVININNTINYTMIN